MQTKRFSRWLMGTVAFLCTLLLMNCGGAAAQNAQSFPTGQPSRSVQPGKIVTTHTWEAIALPVAGQQLSDYVASPGDAQTIYACLKENTVQLTLWRTRDAGQHWSRLALPVAAGTGCSLSLARNQPQHIAVLVKNVVDDQHPCGPVSLYVSTDGGQNWLHRTHSVSVLAQQQEEDCQVAVTAHHIYLWYTYGGGQASPQRSLLERSDDDGSTWSRADTAFGNDSLFLMPQIAQDETLNVIVHPESGTTSLSQLWCSHDGGRSWRQQTRLPQPVMVYLQQNPAHAAPLYALAHEQIPSNLYRLQLLQNSGGQQWSAIPALPVAGTGAEQSGLLQSLAVTDSGQLLAFGVDPATGIPARSSSPRPTTRFWLWTWNPGAQQWRVISSPLLYSASESCGLCWNAQLAHNAQHASYLYVYHQDDQRHLFRFRLPS